MASREGTRRGFSDGFVRCQIMGFARPAQSSVKERLKLSLVGLVQVAPYRYRVGNHRRHIGGDDVSLGGGSWPCLLYTSRCV